MRNKSVWERACGLTRTVVEGVDFDEDGGRDCGVGAAGSAGSGSLRSVRSTAHRVMTSVKVGVGGERWIWARRRCSSKRTRRECGAVIMV